MRQSQTAVLERNTTFRSDFETEPFEVGWAIEARWFVQVLRCGGEDAALELRTQISPDGITWCDEDGTCHETREPGLISWPVREFGQWLRIRAQLRGADASFQLRIYLVVKS
jgi:hypothetical protein